MLGLGVRYLTGFVTASAPYSYDDPEWPPHPGRIFMALAAAHFETGADPVERRALEWLESLGTPPAISAGTSTARAVVTQYVPVNDKAGPAAAILQSAPAVTRVRQPRTFARAWLDHETVYLVWPEAEPPDEVREALGGLCGKVTRVGHSASLVQMWLAAAEEVREPTWVPDQQRPELQLRVALRGTLDYLERCYNREIVETWGELVAAATDPSDKKVRTAAKRALREQFKEGEPLRRRPELRLYEGYARPRGTPEKEPAAGTVFSPHLVVRTLLRESGPYRELDLACVPQVVRRWRDAILTHVAAVSAAVRSVLSGHDPDGRPLEGPHLAFVPLAFVGHPHADGHLLGMGLALPRTMAAEDRRQALRAVARVERLLLGRLGTWGIGSPTTVASLWNLQPEAWTADPDGATHWATVTPIAFDRHPKTTEPSAFHREVAAMIAEACTRIGLPRPREIFPGGVSAHSGVPPTSAFPKLARKDGGFRQQTHAVLVFDAPVRGPILLGAGRYRGYGVCRPLRDAEFG